MSDRISLEQIQTHLRQAVPQLVAEYSSGRWPLDFSKAEALSTFLGQHGDSALFRTKKTPMALDAVAEAVALLSFAPGGVRFMGLEFETKTESKKL